MQVVETISYRGNNSPPGFAGAERSSHPGQASPPKWPPDFSLFPEHHATCFYSVISTEYYPPSHLDDIHSKAIGIVSNLGDWLLMTFSWVLR